MKPSQDRLIIGKSRAVGKSQDFELGDEIKFTAKPIAMDFNVGDYKMKHIRDDNLSAWAFIPRYEEEED